MNNSATGPMLRSRSVTVPIGICSAGNSTGSILIPGWRVGSRRSGRGGMVRWRPLVTRLFHTSNENVITDARG